ncbi:60Kd inner membrane protein-domain-containing protein [Amylocarpus encephaloides]|uniref:60Kd inner membrane protein-domain-containing protein n=1 Tax=Amylocarpus encephaloides TaxID=45428 RepID=A0A9P7YPJ8_9HELO|nr:60Kd inner membrane protein-domain-containing protein [Amylocarpus encephaloides]
MPIFAHSSSLLRPSPPAKLLHAFVQLPSSCHAFHASPKPQFLDTIIAPTHALFEGIHSFTGLPWVYSIPLAALAIRSVIMLPVSIHTRRNLQKQAELAPVLHAWNSLLRQAAMKEAGHLGPIATQAALAKKARKKRNEIYARHGCRTISNYLPILSLPVFLAAVECLRMMSGYHSGLLGMMASSIAGTDEVATDVTSIYLEPGFASEGGLWFPDLTKADPELRLPFMLSGVMLLSIGKSSSTNQEPTIWQKRLRRSLGVMALAAGPLLIHVPSSMLVYWISSSLLAQGQALVLDRLMPVKPIGPCKPRRPLGIGRTLENRKP